MEKDITPLLKTKLYVPPQRPNLVFRPRLMAQLDESLHLDRRLTLISARAGSGKTTLVSEWLRQQARPSAWLSLDEHDNDSQRFFSYLVEALRPLGVTSSQAWPGAGERQDFPTAEILLVTGLINAIATSSNPLILVLDDYHRIHNAGLHSAISFLLEHQPRGLHLVVITRVDPQLPLAQLRARGQLTEIRDRDLRFTAGEVNAFLNEVMALNLPARAVALIEQRTEGWIAGLQLAAISARAHRQEGDLDTFIEAFNGTNRFILDYLMDEVLSQQPPEIQDFLIETSILEQMCGALCDAVRSDRTASFGSHSILVQLERSNLFVIPLDDERRWYRYHHLFADLLQSILRQRRSAEQIRELHRRASQWYQEENLPSAAMIHLIAAQEFEQAADLIDEHILELLHMVAPDQSPLIVSWIAQLPEAIRHGRPWISLYRANMLALNLQLDEVEPILADVEKRMDLDSDRAAAMQGHIAAIRAYTANLRGDAAQAITMAALAQKQLPGDEYPAARATIALTLADTYLALDDPNSASEALQEQLAIGERTNQLMIIVPALCNLAAISVVQGYLHQAEALYDQAYRWLVQLNGLESRVRCSYEFGLADLLREWNRLDEAQEHAARGIAYRRRLGGYGLIGDLAWMRVLQARGDVQAALQALRDAELTVQSLPFQLAHIIEFRAARVTQWLMAGDVEMASFWARECSGGSEQEQIALARLRLAQGAYGEAHCLLAEQVSRAEAGGRNGRLIELLGLQALALDALGQPAAAEDVLARALSLARPEGYLRLFLDLGPPMRDLLERLAGSGVQAGGYVGVILGAFPQEIAAQAASMAPALATMADPLTARELEVLQLVAEGLTNKEIAARLVVAPGTVKQHLKHISSKLDVRGRMQAVRRAQELKLL